MFKQIIFLFAILALFTGCKETMIKSFYTDNKIIIDGKLTEWAEHPLQHFENEHFSISLQHNNTELYIVLATRERQLMKIVQTSGIDIWVDTNKKKKKEYGLHFVGNIDTLDFSQVRYKKPPSHIDSLFPTKQKPGTVLFKNFGNEYLIENFKKTEPRVAVDMYKSVYLIEFRIPFSDEELFTGINVNEKIKINVGIEFGFYRSDMKKMMGGSRPSGTMGGGRGGSGRRGGDFGSGHQDRSQQIGKINKWFTVVLENENLIK